MRQILGFLLVLSCLVLTNDAALRADEPIQLVLAPKAGPTPSLKYRLLPPDEELVPGNAATLYYRCFAWFMEASKVMDKFKGELVKDGQGNEHSKVGLWLKTPFKELPQSEVEGQLSLFSFIRKEARLGSRKQDCAWELHGRNTLISLLPEVQSFRPLSELIVLQARLDMAQGRLDSALDSLQTNMAMARHLCHGPTMIHALVGAAIARLTLEQVDDFLQIPGAPNLYWALTALPAPFGTIDTAIHEEKYFIELLFPTIKELKKGPASQEIMNALHKEIESFKKSLDIRGRPEEAVDLVTQGVNSEAKKNLIASGYTAEMVEKMPNLQVAILDSIRRFEAAQVELNKWRLLPFYQVREQYEKALPAYKEACSRLDFFLFQGVLERLSFYDGYLKAWQALVRIDQRIALLRCIEAVRMHAAEHGGQPPETLAAVKIVPIPLDPMTGQPFSYAVKGKEITLQAAPAEKDVKPSLSYKIQLK